MGRAAGVALTTVRRVSDAFIDDRWDDIVPVLQDYIRIPNKSPAFDPEWEAHGHMDRAVQLVSDWLTVTLTMLLVVRLPESRMVTSRV